MVTVFSLSFLPLAVLKGRGRKERKKHGNTFFLAPFPFVNTREENRGKLRSYTLRRIFTGISHRPKGSERRKNKGIKRKCTTILIHFEILLGTLSTF